MGLKYHPLTPGACPTEVYRAAARLLWGRLSTEDTTAFLAHCAVCSICRASVELERVFLRSIRLSMLSAAAKAVRRAKSAERGGMKERRPD